MSAEPADLDPLLRSLSQPVRRQILRAVAEHERSVGELQQLVGLPQPAVSRHLAELRSVGVVNVRTEGTRRLYSVRTEGLQSAAEFLQILWPSRLRTLRDVIVADLAEERTDDA